MDKTKWIWQTKAWPQLRYDQQAVSSAVFRARLAEAKLVGKAEAIGFAVSSLDAQALPWNWRRNRVSPHLLGRWSCALSRIEFGWAMKT